MRPIIPTRHQKNRRGRLSIFWGCFSTYNGADKHSINAAFAVGETRWLFFWLIFFHAGGYFFAWLVKLVGWFLTEKLRRAAIFLLVKLASVHPSMR